MNFRSKRLLALVPVLLLTSVASTSFNDNEYFTHSCQQDIDNGNASTSCRLIVNSLSWSDWFSGSSSTQFHFIDLLELLSSTDGY